MQFKKKKVQRGMRQPYVGTVWVRGWGVAEWLKRRRREITDLENVGGVWVYMPCDVREGSKQMPPLNLN